MTAYRPLSRYRGESSFKTWVLSIAWRKALDRRRSLKRWLRLTVTRDGFPEGTPDLIERVASGQPSHDDRLAGDELTRQLKRLVGALPRKLRDALLLAGSGEYSYEEIGKMLSIPVGTVKWRVSEARRILRIKAEQGKPAPAAQQPAPQPSEAPPPRAEPRPPAQLANVRLELAISDQRGTATPATKTVTMVVSDRGTGRVRSSGETKGAGGTSQRPVYLNVDAQPEFIRDGRVRVLVTLEYRPSASEGAAADDAALTHISESFTVILEDGKPLVVTQSADPSSDRKVKVEIKATILK